jgi:hypothetical protein
VPQDFLKDVDDEFRLVCSDENRPSILVVDAEKHEDKYVGHHEEDDESCVQELVFEFEEAAREYVNDTNQHGV